MFFNNKREKWSFIVLMVIGVLMFGSVYLLEKGAIDQDDFFAIKVIIAVAIIPTIVFYISSGKNKNERWGRFIGFTVVIVFYFVRRL